MLIREATIADARAIAEVHVDSWRTTYGGMLPDAFLAALSPDRSEELVRATFLKSEGRTWTYVAEDDEGTIVGFARGGPERSGHPEFTGEIYAIYLRQGAQRGGTGRGMMLANAHRLLASGISSMLIWVLEQNPSRHFYEACGGAPATRRKEIVAGLELDVIGYGWHDLDALVASGARREIYYGLTKKNARPNSA
jgi:GNAT superfamily N-acetyltransferase